MRYVPILLENFAKCWFSTYVNTDMGLFDISVDFPSAYNDSVSSVDTGGPDCDFYTYDCLSSPLIVCYFKHFVTITNMIWWTRGETCSGESWTASGTNYLIPGQYNDAFSSVACMV